MIWPFRRRKPVHVGPTSVDWKPGDMAECICESGDWQPNPGPDLGSRWMVSSVFYGESHDGLERSFALRLVGWGTEGFEASNFRKITLTDTGADRTVGTRIPKHHRRKEDA